MAHESHGTAMKLMELLPAIYQEPGTPEEPNYLPELLAPFERILFGAEGKPQTKGSVGSSLSEKVVSLHRLFDPSEAPEEFLPWLASWAALSLRATMATERKRELVANIIPLYRIRGTRKYLEELLRICVDIPTAVEEEEIPALQVGKHSTVGRDMYIGGGPPHFFRVKLMAANLTVPEVEAQRELAYEVVELAKPAHTSYEFWIDAPVLQVGVHSTVGIDTVLGAAKSV